jgi:hypothetical protein
MKQQLMTNAQCVHSLSGGGDHGYLGLLLDPREYALISNTPFVRPVMPVVPNNTGASQHETHRLQTQYREDLRVYQECRAVKTTLRHQIVTAIQPHFLAELRNSKTNAIDKDLNEIVSWLFKRYGNVNSNRVRTEEQKIVNLTWHVSEPPSMIFTKIEDFCRLAAAANLPKTEQQKINYGMDIIKKTGLFTEPLRMWYNKGTNVDWEDFKDHFQNAHVELERISGETISQTPFHQVNAAIEELSTEVGDFRNEVLATVAELARNNTRSPAPPTPEEFNERAPPATAYTNATMNATTAQVNQELIRLLQAMHEQMCTLTFNTNTNNRNGGKHTAQDGSNKYCWSHGKCGHTGLQC